MATATLQTFNYIQTFSCLAERCEANCCEGEWRIEVGSRPLALYRDMYPELLPLIATDAGGNVMKQVDGHCVALTAGRCSFHAEAGESALPDTCANYPRMYRRFNDITVKSATMSCPEISRLVLFGDKPFARKQIDQDDLFLSGVNASKLADFSTENWAGVIDFLMDFAQSDSLSVGQILLRLHDLAPRLAALPEAQWVEQLPHLAAVYRAPETAVESVTAEPVLIVLMTILKSPQITEEIRERVVEMIAVESEELPPRTRLRIKPAWRAMASGAVGMALEPILKKYIAAEMTRTGFPFISTTSAGRDYGKTLSEWTSTLAIRTLALRYLLLAHCDTDLQQPPEPALLVAVMYRFCRAANHSAATAPEIDLRLRVSSSGSGILQEIAAA